MTPPKNRTTCTENDNNSVAATASPDGEREAAAKHYQDVTKGLGGISWRFLIRGKWQYLPMLLSDFGREIVRRKYDAIATDLAYENTPSGLLGPVGAWVDRQVLNLPLHQDLRHRLRFVVEGLMEQSQVHAQERDGTIRILSAPCGLTRDILTTKTELSTEAPDIADRLEFHGLDLDPTGEVVPIAQLRAKEAGMGASFYQANLFDQESVKEVLPIDEGFQIVNCIGLTPWINLEEVEYLIRFFHDLLGMVFDIEGWKSVFQVPLSASVAPGCWAETVGVGSGDGCVTKMFGVGRSTMIFVTSSSASRVAIFCCNC